MPKRICASEACALLLEITGRENGEIDLVMRDDDTLVFVEVKYRSRSTHGQAVEMVTRKKQSKIIATAMAFLQRNPKYQNQNARFDVLALSGENTGDNIRIEWITNAFYQQ